MPNPEKGFLLLLLLVSCATQQARHFTGDQHSYPRKTALSIECKPAGAGEQEQNIKLCHSISGTLIQT
eukprot:1143405-Pelagomonas_calceolata.AAC.2